MPWIRFRAKMYNVTAGEYYDSAPNVYTLAYYSGNQIAMGEDGTTRTDIPIGSFDGIDASNIGIRFEGIAKEYFSQHNVWPILRLCTTNSTTDFYLEWNHASPTGFTLCTNGHAVRWDHCYAWNDTIGSSGGHAYINKWCYVWVSAWRVEDLNTLSIIWTGGLTGNSALGTWETIISYATLSISVSSEFILTEPTLMLTTNAKRYQSAGDRYRYFEKTGDGVAIAFVYKTGQWIGPGIVAPLSAGQVIPPYSVTQRCYGDYSGTITTYGPTIHWNDIDWGFSSSFAWDITDFKYTTYESYVPVFEDNTATDPYTQEELIKILTWIDPKVTLIKSDLYIYLTQTFQEEPGTDVDPDNPPDPDEPPSPVPPDNPDPYYDPTSDPDSPEYDPKKDPDSPEYDPSEPATPHRPPTTEGGGDPPVKTPEDPVEPPPTPPPHAINSRFVTLYTPSLSQLNDLAAYLWSPAWSVDGFKKIFANPMDCILGLMIFPALTSPAGSKEVNVGNLSTGVTMSYVDNQYVELNCGSFEVKEYYASYLDYDPYTKIEIYLPYIGTHKLSADDVMNKTIQLKYMIDLLSGACVAFLVVDGTTLYTFTGSCATPIPVSGNDWSNMVNGILSVAGAAAAAVISGGSAATMAAGAVASSSLFVSSHKEHIRHGGSVASAAGLMSIQKPYLIITHPRQALPIAQNSFQGYPSFMTESLGSLNGYTEVESCHLEHIPCTAEELEEIERLLKGGVLF